MKKRKLGQEFEVSALSLGAMGYGKSRDIPDRPEMIILRPFENPKKQSDGGGRLNPSRFLFRLAFLSWPLAPVRRIALFLQDS